MNHLADFVLMYTKNIENAIDEKREDMCVQRTGGGSSNHAFVSDPTCQKAMQNILPVGTVQVAYGAKTAGTCDVKTLRNPEKWLDVVNLTWDVHDGTQQGILMKLRYKEGVTNMHELAKRLAKIVGKKSISYQRCYVMLDAVHRFVIKTAKECGAYEIKTKKIDRLEEILAEIEIKKWETSENVEKKNEDEEITVIGGSV